MRWNLYVAALAASWGLISVIVAHVDLSATVLVFWRVAIAAVTVAVACVVVRPNRPPARCRTSGG